MQQYSEVVQLNICNDLPACKQYRKEKYWEFSKSYQFCLT